MDGIVKVVLARVRPPAAAATPPSRATFGTEEEPSRPRPGGSPSSLTFWGFCPGVKVCWYLPAPGEPGLGGAGAAVVITMSVPTPYRAFSTAACACRTPAEAAVTVTT